MIELRADGSIPGQNTHGRVYKVVDPMTGEVGYNCWASDLPQGEPHCLERIEGYDSFHGYVSEILPIAEVEALVQSLNRKPKEKIDTPHTLMVKRVRARLALGNAEAIDGITVLQDMAEMLLDIEGRRGRPALPGWRV